LSIYFIKWHLYRWWLLFCFCSSLYKLR